MSEFRQDIVNNNWVLISGSRRARPDEYKHFPAAPPKLPEYDEKCYFCAGNEHLTPEEIVRYPETGDWLVRVIPNKYEAVGHDLGKRQEDFYSSRPGVGDHEVVITRPHNKPLALQDISLIDLMLKVYIDRINELRFHDEIRYVHVIQNHGVQAGASIVHPHSQIFGIPFLPDRLTDELQGTRNYFRAHGACVYCEMVLHEQREKERVVVENEDFVVIAPYASKMAYECHILPKNHRASFHEITISERKNLAKIMKDLFSRFFHSMNNPAYNYYIHTLPFGGSTTVKSIDDRLSYHWHIVVLPRINIWAGFELGTEVYVNIVPPEDAAKTLANYKGDRPPDE